MRQLHLNSLNLARVSRVTTFCAALAFIGGCSKDSNPTETPPPTGAQSITMAFASTSATASSATPATIGVSMTRTGGYTGSVTLTMEGLPTGITALFDPAVLTGTTSSSILTLTVGPTAVSGVSTITVRGTGTGVTSSTATMQLTVGAAAVNVTAGASATAQQGGSTTVPITLERVNGFAGSVTLTAEGLPAGVTATFVPALVVNGATTSTLTLTATAAALPGTTPIMIRAAGTAIADKTATVQFTVTARP